MIPEALASHQVDHVISEKHGGETVSENLALSCSFCNQAKGSDEGSIDGETGEYVGLYHPRRDRWVDHFEMNEETGDILGDECCGSSDGSIITDESIGLSAGTAIVIAGWVSGFAWGCGLEIWERAIDFGIL